MPDFSEEIFRILKAISDLQSKVDIIKGEIDMLKVQSQEFKNIKIVTSFLLKVLELVLATGIVSFALKMLGN